MKIYVSDIGDGSVGIQELTIATLDIHESMVEVLEDENEMDNFKKEFMALIDKYCQPEVSYEVYSDKDLEEEAKFEEEMSKETMEMDKFTKEALEEWYYSEALEEWYYSEKPSVINVLSGKASTEHVPNRIVNVIGAETRR